MRKSKWLWALPLAGAAGLGLWAALGGSAPVDAASKVQDLRPAVALPITRVVLFNSGVGYFARSGEVNGEAHVDLQFPETDVNDLLKSMTLEDFDGGRVAAVSFDSREPIARTLSSFSINLNGNPTLAQILTQARGEKIEVAMQPLVTTQSGVLTGTIVGLEKQKVPVGTAATIDVEVLNLWCSDGMRAVKLSDVQRVRFANPVLESEFRRALDVLALNHDSQKKAVSLHFAGEGKRRVQVGYVVEAPVWKTSYRLVLDKEGKPYLQGWAAVENPSDDDWSNVRMALVSGRPISFKMDLYNPLYVPRPTVEPELFASLRPPTYQGGFEGTTNARAAAGQEPPPFATPMAPAAKGEAPLSRRKGAAPNQDKAKEAEKLRYAGDVGRELEKRMNMGAVGSAATASALGDFYQYVVDHPVTLARQKSALLPIVGKDVEGQRVSIYNLSVQAKHPLLGLKFKNTTGVHLNQGPITVFEGSMYAGDTRILDVQPNEERLVSYAIDLGTDVDPQNGPGSTRIMNIKAVKGIITINRQLREEKKYRIANRSQINRVLLIEHPNRTNQQFKLVDTPKPIEDTPEFYRFQTKVAAGKEGVFTVIEERNFGTEMVLSNSNTNQILQVISLNEASESLKAKLKEALALKGAADRLRRELQQVETDLRRLSTDQERIRKNLKETPKEAEVYMVYLKKLSDQEKEVDALAARQKDLTGKEFAAKKAYEDFLANLSD